MSSADERPLWRFIPLEAYSVPPVPAAEKVRKGVRYVVERIRNWKNKSEGVGGPSVPVRLPEEILDAAAPFPDWGAATDALGAALSERFDSANRRTGAVQVLVGAPGGSSEGIVAAWAEAKQWRTLEPPGLERILRGDAESLEAVSDEPQQPLALPALDHWYVRHADGLGCLQQLLHRLASRPGPSLLGCGIWSWVYLSRTLGIDGLTGAPLVAEAFDEERLRRWFLMLSGGTFSVCETDSEKPLLADSNARRRDGSAEAKDEAEFLKHLAGYSRGVPLVAWAVWRHALQLPCTDGDRPGGGSGDAAPLLVVPHWSRLQLPQISGGVEPDDLLVMQLLLLHGNVAFDLLGELLPISSAAIERSVRRLADAGIVESENDRWHVGWLSYSAVRQHLHDAGFLPGVC